MIAPPIHAAPGTARTYTVVGFWYEDAAVAVGVIAGHHEVTDSKGTSCCVNGAGEWHAHVTATNPEHAQSLACTQVRDQRHPAWPVLTPRETPSQ